MGYFYPPPPPLIGGKQPYAPALGLVQSGPVPQAPPLRGAIAVATFGIILSSWQPSFLPVQGAGHIAPLLQAAAGVSQPPPLNRSAQSVIQAAWQQDPTTIISLTSVAPFAAGPVTPPQPSGVNLQLILQAWQPPPYVVQGSGGDFAPTLPVVSQPNPVSSAKLHQIRSTWETPWSSAWMQGAGDIAPTVPTGATSSQPPLQSRVQLSIVQAVWQSDVVTQISLSSVAPLIAADQPPVQSGTNLQIVVQAWQPAPYSIQGAGDIAPSLPIVSQPPAVSRASLQSIVRSWDAAFVLPPGAGDIAPSLPIVSQPQPVSLAQLFTIRATWDPPWSSAYMQGIGDIAPNLASPAASSPPPLTKSGLQTLIRSAWDYDPITVVSLASIAPFVAQADQPPVPSDVNFQTILQSWLQAFVPPSRQQGIATQPLVNAPPVNTDSLFYELVAANQPPPYAIPKAAAIASWLPPAGAPSQPQPVSPVVLNLIVRSWEPPVWWPLPRNGPIAQTATVVSVPTPNSGVVLDQLISLNQPPPYALPKAGTVASWLPPAGASSQPQPNSAATLNLIIRAWDAPVWWPLPDSAPIAPFIPSASQPPVSAANLRLLLQSWDLASQPQQRRSVVTVSGPLPDPPPPSSRVNLQTIIQANQPPWNYGQGFGFIGAYPIYSPVIQATGPTIRFMLADYPGRIVLADYSRRIVLN